jgi:hypothetical protein
VISAPEASDSAQDQVQKSPGTVEDNASVGTKAWSNPSNAKASDNSYATCELAAGKQSHHLLAKNFGFEIPETARIVGIVAEVERKASASNHDVVDLYVKIVKGGSITGTNQKNLYAWPTSDAYKVYGASDDLWGEEWEPEDINAEGFGLVVAVENNSTTTAYTASVDHIRLTPYYTEAVDENRVCFAKRSIELRSDGVYRQHLEDDVWGALVPEGFLPKASPSGLEGRPTRFALIPSQGDLEELADSEDNALTTQAFTRAGYLVAREAA